MMPEMATIRPGEPFGHNHHAVETSSLESSRALERALLSPLGYEQSAFDSAAAEIITAIQETNNEAADHSTLQHMAADFIDVIDFNDEKAVADSVKLLNYLEEAHGETLDVWRTLQRLPSHALQQLVAQRDEALLTILARASTSSALQDPSTYRLFVGSVLKVLPQEWGHFSQWRQSGQVLDGVPVFVRHLAESTYFTQTCLAAFPQKSTDQERHFYDGVVRDYERQIAEHMLGLPPELVDEFQIAIAERTRQKDRDDRTLPYSYGGGVDMKRWHEHMERFIESIEAIGPENAIKLRRLFGIVNFDRYQPEQLMRMLRLVRKDSEFLQHLNENDVTVLIIDALGDQNGAFNEDPSLIDEATGDRETVLFFEAHQQSDSFYRPLSRLFHTYGVTPSNVVVSTHGRTWGMEFTGKNGATIVTKQDISRSNIQRAMRKYMRPRQDTGLRHIALLSCDQAASSVTPRLHAGIASRRTMNTDGGFSLHSTAEILASMTSPEDKVIISAPDRAAEVDFNEATGQLHFFSTQPDASRQDFPATHYFVSRDRKFREKIVKRQEAGIDLGAAVKKID